MLVLPVRGDNPRVLASGLSYVHVDSVDLAHHELFRAKVGNGDIKLHLTRDCHLKFACRS